VYPLDDPALDALFGGRGMSAALMFRLTQIFVLI